MLGSGSPPRSNARSSELPIVVRHSGYGRYARYPEATSTP